MDKKGLALQTMQKIFDVYTDDVGEVVFKEHDIEGRDIEEVIDFIKEK